MTTYKAGSDIDTFCSRCQLELAHIIIAVKDGRPVRVQCKTCRNEHAYRGPKAAKAAKAPKATATRSSRAKSSSPRAISPAQYDELMSGKDLSRAQRYKVSGTFDEGVVVDHQSFGFGLVTRVLADNKIEVLFQQGMKMLAHARG